MREYAIRQVCLDTGRTLIHGHTDDVRIVQVWREHKMARQHIVWREVGDWQDDAGEFDPT
jgi:hypothetical protein